jgi:hypothetical protein
MAWQLAVILTQQPLLLRILLLFLAWFSLWFFTHDLTHHLIGKITRIKFEYYFFGRSAIRKLNLPLVSGLMEKVPVFVLKINQDSLHASSPKARRWMYASGAIASMALPWIIVPSSFMFGSYWVGVLFAVLVFGNVLFTLYFSPKTGDLYRAKMVKG